MGLVTTLIGNYSRSKMEEQAQKSAEIQQRIQADTALIKSDAPDDAKQFAQADITRLLYQHGGPEGRKHAPTIGTILGTLAGTMGEMAGRARPQQAPPPPPGPVPRMWSTQQEIEAKKQQEWERDFERKKKEEQYGMALRSAEAGAAEGARTKAQREEFQQEQQEDLKWMDEHQAELEKGGMSREEFEEKRLQIMAPRGVKFTEPKPVMLTVRDRDTGTTSLFYGNPRDVDQTRFEVLGKTGTAKLPSDEELSGELKTRFQTYLAEGKDRATAKRLAAADMHQKYVNKENIDELNLKINRLLSGFDEGAPATAPGAPTPSKPGEPTPTAPKKLTPGNRRLVDLYMRNVATTGTATAGGRGAGAAGALQGQEILGSLTGLDPVSMAVEVKDFQANMKSLTDTQEMANAYNQINRRIEAFGKNFEQTARKVKNLSGRWLNTPWRELKLGVVGDPDVDQYLMALNGLDRLYTMLTANPESRAQLPVGIQQHIQTMINPGMTLQESLAIVPQLKAEAGADIEGFNNAIGDLRQKVNTSPIGQALGAPQNGAGAAGGGRATGTPKRGDKQSYQGATYVFDGTQWVRQ